MPVEMLYGFLIHERGRNTFKNDGSLWANRDGIWE